MKLLGIDVETTGLDTEKDRITEIGCVVWDTDKRQPLWLYNVNLIWDDMPELTKEIVELTGIDAEHLDEYADRNVKQVMQSLAEQMASVGICVAHNAPFDKGMLDTGFMLAGVEPPEVLWVDTSVDIPYPPSVKTRKLIHLGAEHTINPNKFAHRALFDVLQMFEVLGKYDINEVIERAKSPNVTLQAMTRKPWQDPKADGEKDTDIAKANGFRFDGSTKTWTKQCKANEVDAIIAALPFPTRVME